jgi:hypothetical protein
MTEMTKRDRAVLIHHPDCYECPCQHVLWCIGNMPDHLCGFNYFQQVCANAYTADILLDNGRVQRIFVPMSCPRVNAAKMFV